MTVTIDASVQATYPPRVAVTLAGLTLGDEVVIYRSVSGNRTVLRGGTTDDSPDTGMVVIDAELPFGVPVTYMADVEGSEYATSATTYTLTGGKVALSDAISALSAEVAVLAADRLSRTRSASRFVTSGGRNIVVGRGLSGRAGAYDLYVETTTAAENLALLLEQATEGIVQIRQPGGYDGIDAYLAVTDIDETRWSQDGTDERRIFTIQFAEVEAWPADLLARSFTYGEVATFYSGLTYADAAADFATYLDAESADYS